MSLPDGIASPRTTSAGVLLLSLSLLAGCANPGSPRPPSLHLPQVVSDLSAERVGAEVRLHWTTPSKTTDGISITTPIVAQICRDPAVAAPTACSPVNSIPVKPGLSEATDLLPDALRTDPQTLLAYRVTLLNNRQRSAGPSSPAFVASGSVPPAITGLRIEATEQGALLQWTPEEAADTIELDRTHRPATGSPTAAQPHGQAFQPAEKEPSEMRFRAARTTPGSSPFRSDAGGSLDATAHRGETYTYTAQRVRSTVLQGHTLEIRSVPSAAVSISMRDSFPPKPPAGLAAILTGQAATSPAIDLSWRPNVELDLGGYLVYRQELSPEGAALGDRLRLTREPVLEPGFRDTTVVAGHIYSYALTAVDTSGNESAPGISAREEVPLP